MNLNRNVSDTSVPKYLSVKEQWVNKTEWQLDNETIKWENGTWDKFYF